MSEFTNAYTRPGEQSYILPTLRELSGDPEAPRPSEMDWSRAIHDQLSPLGKVNESTEIEFTDPHGQTYDQWAAIVGRTAEGYLDLAEVPLGWDDRPLDDAINLTVRATEGSEAVERNSNSWLRFTIGTNGIHRAVYAGEANCVEEGLMPTDEMVGLAADIHDRILPNYAAAVYIEYEQPGTTTEFQLPQAPSIAPPPEV